ncbi:hypothetical protein QF039_004021 [Pseudomonas sp. W2I6]|nr:hypothetical protein [Pseudomonas sp. W2I6]
MLEDADRHAADQVDKQNQQAGDGVAAHEFAGTVHGTVELGFLGDFKATGLGLVLVDQAGVEVGVDRHLLAGHRVEGKTRAHLGNPPGALGHDHEVDDHQDRKNHDTDHVVTADHHLAEGLDHLARGGVAVLAVEHHHPGGSHVKREPQQGGDQQDGREYREIQRPQGVYAHQQYDDRQRNVEGEEHIQQERRHRQHHHCQHHQQQQRHTQIASREVSQGATGRAEHLRAIHRYSSFP